MIIVVDVILVVAGIKGQWNKLSEGGLKVLINGLLVAIGCTDRLPPNLISVPNCLIRPAWRWGAVQFFLIYSSSSYAQKGQVHNFISLMLYDSANHVPYVEISRYVS